MGKALVKIKPKKYKVGDIVKVDFIAIHPMATGMQKDKKTKKIIPAKYINDVEFFFNDKSFTKLKVWESVSTNPYFSVMFKVPGDGKITVKYKDNAGESGEAKKKVKPKAA